MKDEIISQSNVYQFGLIFTKYDHYLYFASVMGFGLL